MIRVPRFSAATTDTAVFGNPKICAALCIQAQGRAGPCYCWFCSKEHLYEPGKSVFVAEYECMYSILPFFLKDFSVGTIRSGVATTIFTNSTLFYIRRLAHPH